MSHMINHNHFNTPELIKWGTMYKLRIKSCLCLTKKEKEMTGLPKWFYQNFQVVSSFSTQRALCHFSPKFLCIITYKYYLSLPAHTSFH